mgnify:CR=1 FL=1
MNSEIIPIGDKEGFTSFCEQLSPEVITILLKTAQQSLPEHIEKLRHALDRSDPTLIYEAAHSIKGECGSMFATRISEIAAVAETQCKDINFIRNLMPEIEDAAFHTLEWWHTQNAE